MLVDVTARFTYDSAFMAVPQKRNNETRFTYDLTASSSTEHGHNTRAGGRGQDPMYLLRGLASLIHILGHGTKAIYKGLKPHTSIIVGFLLIIGTVGLSVMLVYWMVMFVIQGCITAWEWINTGVMKYLARRLTLVLGGVALGTETAGIGCFNAIVATNNV